MCKAQTGVKKNGLMGKEDKQSCLRMWVKIWSLVDNTKIQKIHHVIIHNNTAIQKCKLQYYRNTKVKNCGQKHKQSCLRMWVKIWSPLDNTKIQKIHHVIIHNNTAIQKCKLQYYRNTKVKNCGQKHKQSCLRMWVKIWSPLDNTSKLCPWWKSTRKACSWGE